MAREALIGMALTCGLALSGSALADDLTPPPWRLGPGTTFQHWDFSGGPAGGPPDAGLFNPFGVPMLVPGAGAAWLPAAAGRTDVWSLGTGSLTFDVPNVPVAPTTHQKELWLQVTYLAPAAGGGPGIAIGSPSGPFALLGAPMLTPLPGGWVHELTRWGLQVCPTSERVSIFPQQPGVTMLIDQVVIDTRCFQVPTPGSAALLALSGLVAMHRRR